MKNFVMVLTMVALAAATGCKKKDTTTSAGSAAMAGSGATMDPGSAAKPVDDPGAPGSAAAMDPGSAAADGRPAAITDEMIATADKVVAAIDGLAADLKAAGADCKQATAAMKTRFDEMAQATTELEKMKDTVDKDPVAKDWMKATYMAKLESSVNAMMASAMPCKDDKEFTDTFKKFPLMKKKDPPTPTPAP